MSDSGPGSSSGAGQRSLVSLWVGLAAAGGLILGIGGTLGVTSIVADAQRSADALVAEAEAARVDMRLFDAVTDCGNSAGVSLGDKNQTLTVDVQGEDDLAGASYAYQACLLKQLDVPANVESHLSQTTSMDGRQTESWDGLTMSWSYHPSRGSDMVITVED